MMACNGLTLILDRTRSARKMLKRKLGIWKSHISKYKGEIYVHRPSRSQREPLAAYLILGFDDCVSKSSWTAEHVWLGTSETGRVSMHVMLRASISASAAASQPVGCAACRQCLLALQVPPCKKAQEGTSGSFAAPKFSKESPWSLLLAAHCRGHRVRLCGRPCRLAPAGLGSWGRLSD